MRGGGREATRRRRCSILSLSLSPTPSHTDPLWRTVPRLRPALHRLPVEARSGREVRSRCGGRARLLFLFVHAPPPPAVCQPSLFSLSFFSFSQVQENHHLPGGGQSQERLPGLPAGPDVRRARGGAGRAAGRGGGPAGRDVGGRAGVGAHGGRPGGHAGVRGCGRGGGGRARGRVWRARRPGRGRRGPGTAGGAGAVL